MELQTTTLDTNLLSNQDYDYLAELISAYLSEQGIYPESFSYSVEIEYTSE